MWEWEDENLPPESTTFEFPLYLNTRIIEKSPDYLFREREADEISNQLYEFYCDNMIGVVGSISWPPNFFNDYPVFIDGYQVEDIGWYEAGFERIKTDKDYGDYNSTALVFADGWLWVDGYN